MNFRQMPGQTLGGTDPRMVAQSHHRVMHDGSDNLMGVKIEMIDADPSAPGFTPQVGCDRRKVPGRTCLSSAALGAGLPRLRGGSLVLGRLQQQAAEAVGPAGPLERPLRHAAYVHVRPKNLGGEQGPFREELPDGGDRRTGDRIFPNALARMADARSRRPADSLCQRSDCNGQLW